MNMRKYVTEFVGAFFLVLTVGLTVIKPGADAFAPLAIGSVLMVMIYAGGHISGGHYNPAVTLAVWLRGKCPTSDVAGYIVAQLLGASVAALFIGVFKAGSTITPLTLDVLPAFLAETLFTFALAYVVLNAATVESVSGNSYFGLAIGFTVLVGAYAVGGISGGAFNPAVALGITLMGLSSWANLWIFLVANFLGGAMAAGLFRYLHPEEYVSEHPSTVLPAEPRTR